MWGGPTPHNLVTLSLCCAVRTCSEVPITSSDRDTTEAREGRPHSPSLGHPCPGAGSSIYTTRSTLTIGYPPRVQHRQTRPWDHAGDTTHFGRNKLKEKDYGRSTPVTHAAEIHPVQMTKILRDVFHDPQLAHKYVKHLDKKVQVDSSVSQEPEIVPDPESSTDTQY